MPRGREGGRIMICNHRGCRESALLTKAPGPTSWTIGDPDTPNYDMGCPISPSEPLNGLCYYHHKKDLGLFITEPEDYRKGGKYYAQDKGPEF